jgi:hypothetical protein
MVPRQISDTVTSVRPSFFIFMANTPVQVGRTLWMTDHGNKTAACARRCDAGHCSANRGNALFRKLLLVAAAALALVLPAAAADDPQLARIAAMPAKELDAFIGTVATAVNGDSLKMRGFAQSGDCLDLTRAANSFALAYTYLAAARDTARLHTEKVGPLIAAKAVQLRVTTFAARVRAEEWLTQRCRNFTVPADKAADPRYQVPLRVSNAEYTEAVIDARQTAETNLAIAVAAGLSGKCPDAVVAGQSIALLLPYLDKLLADTAKRPEVLGPRASRRGLEVSRRQLIAALDKLQAEFGQKCKPPKPDAGTDTKADPATDPKPAE